MVFIDGCLKRTAPEYRFVEAVDLMLEVRIRILRANVLCLLPAVEVRSQISGRLNSNAWAQHPVVQVAAPGKGKAKTATCLFRSDKPPAMAVTLPDNTIEIWKTIRVRKRQVSVVLLE